MKGVTLVGDTDFNCGWVKLSYYWLYARNRHTTPESYRYRAGCHESRPILLTFERNLSWAWRVPRVQVSAT